MSLLTIEGVGKEYRRGQTSRRPRIGIDLNIAEGEFVTIVGPSGCGKSTLLNLIVGLHALEPGRISFRGQPIDGICTKIGYVTQKDNLLPWRTLVQNVEIAWKFAAWKPGQRRNPGAGVHRARRLGGFEEHYPHELSGGMRQRANIIRTLIYDPELILMDEPFGPLDAQTRIVLQDQLLQLWSASKKTIIFITHDLVEAITLADRVVLMSSDPAKIKSIENVSNPRPRDVFKIHESAAISCRLRTALAATASRSQVWQKRRKEISIMKKIMGMILRGDFPWLVFRAGARKRRAK